MPAGPLALLPVEFAQAAAGVVMAAEGSALTVTLAVPVFEQVPLPTVRVRPTGPVAPAV